MDFIVWCNGDPTVGDFGNSAEITFNVLTNDPAYVSFIKDQLEKCFTDIWDCKAHCMTAVEFNRED